MCEYGARARTRRRPHHLRPGASQRATVCSSRPEYGVGQVRHCRRDGQRPGAALSDPLILSKARRSLCAAAVISATQAQVRKTVSAGRARAVRLDRCLARWDVGTARSSWQRPRRAILWRRATARPERNRGARRLGGRSPWETRESARPGTAGSQRLQIFSEVGGVRLCRCYPSSAASSSRCCSRESKIIPVPARLQRGRSPGERR